MSRNKSILVIPIILFLIFFNPFILIHTINGLNIIDENKNTILNGNDADGLNRPVTSAIPNDPSNPSPYNGETIESLSTILSVDVSDPDGDSLDVYFQDCLSGHLIGSVMGVQSGGRASVIWDNLYEGLKDCWPVFRNPEGAPEKNDEYLGVPDYGIYPFSQVQ